MFKKFIIAFLPFLASTVLYTVHHPCNAQENNNSFPITNTYSLQPLLFTPAASSTQKTIFQGNYHGYLGSFSDINQTYLSALHQLNTPRYIGGLLLHERTSDFFKRTRLYGIYQEEISLTKQLWVRAGVQVGIINYTMESMGFSPGGSAWAGDMGIGISLGTNKFKTGFAIQQLANSTLQPIIFTYVLNRYTELYAEYSIELGPNINYIPGVRMQLNEIENIQLLSNTIDYKQMHGANVTWNIDNGFSVTSYITLMSLNSSYKIFFSYFSPLSTELKKIDAQQYEMGVNIILQKKTLDTTK